MQSQPLLVMETAFKVKDTKEIIIDSSLQESQTE